VFGHGPRSFPNQFSGLSQLSSLTFTPGCPPSIGSFPQELKSLSLPSSISTLVGSAFAGSSIVRLSLDEANAHYFISGAFLFD
jgi:hypothetical protein